MQDPNSPVVGYQVHPGWVYCLMCITLVTGRVCNEVRADATPTWCCRCEGKVSG